MNVFAVIVCFGPDLVHLRRTCDSLLHGDVKVILVDNSEPSDPNCAAQFRDCTLIANGENVGIARAQNIGIKLAVERDADVVVFLDQDSSIGPMLLPALLTQLEPGVPAVVAPMKRDRAKGFEYPATRVSRHGVQRKVYGRDRVVPYAVDIVLSSGTAATVETFERAGLMDEGLFIDYVDTEWSLRCRSRNVPIHVVPTAVMEHSVGGRSIDLWFTTVLAHSPVRCYYQIRNCFRLFTRESVPFLLSLREAAVLLVHKSLLIVLTPNRGAYLRACAEGVFDGMRGVTGKKPGS